MSIIRDIYAQFVIIWINFKMILLFFKWLPQTISDYFVLRKQQGKDLTFPIKKLFLITQDRYDQWWTTSWHYFHQDLLVAQKIFAHNPQKHVDVWSRIDGFVAHVAVFRKIEVFDIRSLDHTIENVQFTQADLMKLDPKFVDYTDSLSCLHTIEHFGLWRYGDPIDYNWHVKWLNSLYSMLKPWGIFYFSTPIWPQRIEFNGHRVFSLRYLLDFFADGYELLHFHYVDDAWDLHKDVKLHKDNIHNSCGCTYGCGIFELQKK